MGAAASSAGETPSETVAAGTESLSVEKKVAELQVRYSQVVGNRVKFPWEQE